MISVIIPAYNAENYIEECLDSIQNQNYFIKNTEYEILVGVDGCNKTLNKVKEIKLKYKNLHVYNMVDNKGCYVTLNTLLTLVKYDDIFIFGADDIMLPNLVEDCIKINGYIVRYQYYSYINVKNIKRNENYARGSIMIKKKIIEKLGGFRPWLCAADTELLDRAKLLGIKEKLINKRLFYHRKHKNSLTSDPKTNLKSKLRKKYKSSTNKKDIYIKPEINKYIKI